MVSTTQQATFDESMLNVIEMPETLVDFGLELSGYYIVIIHISTHSSHTWIHTMNNQIACYANTTEMNITLEEVKRRVIKNIEAKADEVDGIALSLFEILHSDCLPVVGEEVSEEYENHILPLVFLGYAWFCETSRIKMMKTGNEAAEYFKQL